jgi:hypothetical protein
MERDNADEPAATGSSSPGRVSMGARSEALAKQFETKAEEAIATLERLSDGDWKKTTAAVRQAVGHP